MYEENNIMPPREIAGLMLSAILSDTLIFKSPTCTETDIRMAKRLAKIAEVNLEEYGMDLIAAGTSLEGMTPRELLDMDRKPFVMGQFSTAVAQINTGDFKSIYKMRDEILAEMENLREQEGLGLVVLMVTDVVVGGTELFAVGPEKWIVESAFELPKEDDSIFLKDVFSRKKQIIPQLTAAAQN